MFVCLDLAATAVTGAYSLDIALNTYDAAFIDTLGALGSVILDKETCETDSGFGWFIGTGPYRLAGDGVTDKSGWEESVRYRLVRNELYWGEAPYYDELICRFFSEESTRYSELLSGGLDAAYFSEATYINNIANGAASGIGLVQKRQSGIYGFALSGGDGSNGAMADINIRKAFAHALDIRTIIDTLGEGVYITADSILADTNWAYKSEGVYAYDPDAAAAYLAEAGYSADKPLKLRLVAESTAFNAAVAEAAQSYLAAVGIQLDLSGMGDFGTILPVLISGDMEVSIGGPSNGSGNDPASLLQQLGPESHNSLLRATDPDLVELFVQGSAGRGQDARIDIYKQFQDGVHERYLFIPVWVETMNYGVLDAHSSLVDALDVNNQLNATLLTD
jgi:peptide/nickel transport system substrate-binding protein